MKLIQTFLFETDFLWTKKTTIIYLQKNSKVCTIKNISERNKIDTQSRADAYIRRKRLISKSDYNLNWKTLKTPSSGQIYKKTKKKQKKPKKTTGLGLKKKSGFFPTLPGSAAPRKCGAETTAPAVYCCCWILRWTRRCPWNHCVATPKSNTNNNSRILYCVERKYTI